MERQQPVTSSGNPPEQVLQQSPSSFPQASSPPLPNSQPQQILEQIPPSNMPNNYPTQPNNNQQNSNGNFLPPPGIQPSPANGQLYSNGYPNQPQSQGAPFTNNPLYPSQSQPQIGIPPLSGNNPLYSYPSQSQSQTGIPPLPVNNQFYSNGYPNQSTIPGGQSPQLTSFLPTLPNNQANSNNGFGPGSSSVAQYPTIGQMPLPTSNPSNILNQMQPTPYPAGTHGQLNQNEFPGMNTRFSDLNLYSPEAQLAFMLSTGTLSRVLNDANSREAFLLSLGILRNPNSPEIMRLMQDILNDPQQLRDFMNRYKVQPLEKQNFSSRPVNTVIQTMQPVGGLMDLLKSKINVLSTLFKEEGAAKSKAIKHLFSGVPAVESLVHIGTDVADQGLNMLQKSFTPLTNTLTNYSRNPDSAQSVVYPPSNRYQSQGTYLPEQMYPTRILNQS